jgi:hypothetical protein
MISWNPQFQTAQGLTVSSRMSVSQKELKAKLGITIMTRISLCAFWNPFPDLGGRSPWHHAETPNLFWSSSVTVCPMFQQVNCPGWELCRLSRSLISGGSWLSPKLCIGSTATLLLQSSSQMKEKVVSANPAPVVLRGGTWPWIHLSWSLLTKQHDVCSTQSWCRILQAGTPCCPFFMASSQISEPQSFESSWEFELTSISWRSCFSLEYLAREVGLTVMSWKVTSDWTSDQVLPLQLNSPQLLAT